jgi:hypothetical protein
VVKSNDITEKSTDCFRSQRSHGHFDTQSQTRWHPQQPLVYLSDLYTDTSPYGFLFRLGGQALAGAEVTMALIATQSHS